MAEISRFRLGNYATFDDLIQKIETSTGLSHSRYLNPIPITLSNFEVIGFTQISTLDLTFEYFFGTGEEDGIRVIFSNEITFTISEKVSGVEFPFLKWVHEIQNLVEDRIKDKKQIFIQEGRRTIPVK